MHVFLISRLTKIKILKQNEYSFITSTYRNIERVGVVGFEPKVGDLAGESVGRACVHLVAGVRELCAELEVRERHAAVHPAERERTGQEARQVLLRA